MAEEPSECRRRLGREQRQLCRADLREAASTPYQTAWALLALLAAGEINSQAVRPGVEHLLRTHGRMASGVIRALPLQGFPVCSI